MILQIFEPKRLADFLYYNSLFDCMSFKYFAHQAFTHPFKSLISENRFYMLMFQISDIKLNMAWVQQVAHQTGKEENEAVRQLRQSVAILLVSDNVAMFDSSSLMETLTSNCSSIFLETLIVLSISSRLF